LVESNERNALGGGIFGGQPFGCFDRIFDLSFRQPGDIDAGVIGRLVLFVGGVALGLLFSLMWRSGLGLF